MKTILYKIFGIGKIREPLLRDLKSEGLIASDEGVRSTITYKNFRAPGRYSNWKRRWLTGALAVTDKRLVLQQYSTPAINIYYTDERFKQISVTAETDDCLLFAFDPALFLENSSGAIEYRFRTGQARAFAAALREKSENATEGAG
jgi:hypothetical protein